MLFSLFIFRNSIESFTTAKLSQEFCAAGRWIAVLSTTITGQAVFRLATLTSGQPLQYYLNQKKGSVYCP